MEQEHTDQDIMDEELIFFRFSSAWKWTGWMTIRAALEAAHFLLIGRHGEGVGTLERKKELSLFNDRCEEKMTVYPDCHGSFLARRAFLNSLIYNQL